MTETEGNYPSNNAVWDLDDETEEVVDIGYETRWE